MSSIVGENSKKWLEIIISFYGDPSKYSLPKKVFGLPRGKHIDYSTYIDEVKLKWNKINPRSTKPYDNLEETLPFWMVFTLSKRPSLLYLSVWDAHLEQKDRKLYQDIQYSFQELIQNYIREELGLFQLVRPFRRLTGSSVLRKKSELGKKLDDNVIDQISKYTSPQKVLHQIAEFVNTRTVQSGIAYIMLIERFSELLAKTRNKEQVQKVTKKFEEEFARLKNVTFQRKIPPQTQQKPVKSESIIIETNEKSSLIQFTKVELQEYDGYVEISGYSPEENRNFRIYNCIEEDQLREEMWKNRKYPLRRLLSQIFDEKYNRPTKEYQLAYGVDIDVLPPNWTL